MFKINDIKCDLKLKNKDFVRAANRRTYTNANTEEDFTGYLFNAKHKQTSGVWYPTEVNLNSIKDIPNELMYGVDSYQGLSIGYKIETTQSTYQRFVQKHRGGVPYNAVKLSGKIVSGSFFNCYFFGKFGGGSGSNNVLGYIHKDTTINGKHPLFHGKYIPKVIQNFASFSGHLVVMKVVW